MFRAGLKPGEFSLLLVGAGNTVLTAILQNRIQAGMTTEPTVGQWLKMGAATVMIDLRTPQKTLEALGGPYPAASFSVQSARLDQHGRLSAPSRSGRPGCRFTRECLALVADTSLSGRRVVRAGQDGRQLPLNRPSAFPKRTVYREHLNWFRG